jgi:hypothetical protein
MVSNTLTLLCFAFVFLSLLLSTWTYFITFKSGHRGGRECMVVCFMQPVSITTTVVSSIPAHCEVYSMQQYVINFVGDLLQVGGFLQVLRFPPPIKLTATM